MVKEGLAKYAVEEPVLVDEEEDAPVVNEIAKAREKREGESSDA